MSPVLRTRTKLALARMMSRGLLLSRRAVGRGAVSVVERRGLRWELDLGEGVDLAIYLLGGFETGSARAYERLVRPGATVLDIGANIGAHTLPLARRVVPGGQVIAFEATDFAFAKLRRNLALNPRLETAVVAVQALLSRPGAPAPGRPVFSSWPLSEAPDAHPLHGGRAMGTDGAEPTTVDAALGGLGIERLDFIKIDTDGHEVEILEGAAETLRRFSPPILTEVAPHALAAAGSSLEELLRTLAGHGYRLREPRSGAPVSMDAAALEARIPHGASIDLLAQPAPRAP